MTLALPSITNATLADANAVALLVAEAFFPLRASEWLVPDAEARVETMAGQFSLVVEHAMAFGQVDLLADGSATAVWFHRTQPIPAPAEYEQRLAAACGQYTDHFQVLDSLFEEHHPAEPHHHLAMLAVAPRYQGTGRGALLLRHHHRILETEEIPAYVEAAGIRSARLYHREGYRPFTEPFALPNEAFFYPMWRTSGQGRSPAAKSRVPARRPIGAPTAAGPTGIATRRVPALA